MKTDAFKTVADLHRKQLIPRSPSLSEKADLFSLLLDSITSEQYGIEEEEVINANTLVDSASIAVYEPYSGYAGKLVAVVWSTYPTSHEVFIWPNDLLQKLE